MLARILNPCLATQCSLRCQFGAYNVNALIDFVKCARTAKVAPAASYKLTKQFRIVTSLLRSCVLLGGAYE